MAHWIEFNTAAAAAAFRRDNGTGGWIFVRDDGSAVICPRGIPVSPLMLHPMCAGSGRFI
tara:strand:+ start:1441 stop:1620 length:180 start_codon:yes stop_codon:yes gene_type:complete